MYSHISRRYLSSTRPALLFKALGTTLKNTSPKNFECREVLKPVGVAQKPQATDGIDTRSFSQKRKDWLNNDNRLKRKANLEKEFATSGMYDMFIFRKTGGKVFYAPKSYFKKDKALYFPNFIADRSLSGKKKVSTVDVFTGSGKFNIVRVYSSAVGQNFTKKLFDFPEGEGNYLDSNESYSKLLEQFPDAQVVNLTFYDNIVKKWLLQIFTAKNIKKTSVSTPEYFDNFLLLSTDSLSVPVKESINYLNGITGYVYIVDSDGKIRWLCSGEPTQTEKDTMWKTIRGLQNEK